MNTLKKKKCKQCGELFSPYSSFARACSPKCAIAYNRGQDEKIQRSRDKEWMKANKRVSEVMAEAQAAVNGYVRLRDHGLPCISCGVQYANALVNGGSKWDSGHYRSRGSAGHLRFNLLNIHKQCTRCNRELSGSIVEYRMHLIDKIGVESVDRLENDNSIRKFDRPYLERVKKIFNKRKRILQKRLVLL